VHTLNQSIVPQDFEIDLTQEMKDAGVSLTSPPSRSRVLPGMGSQIHLFLMFPQKLLNERGETVLQIMIREKQAGQENRIPVKAVGPYSSGS
jgi:hypothetical protein